MGYNPSTDLAIDRDAEVVLASCSGELYSDEHRVEAERLLAEFRRFLRRAGRQRVLARLEAMVNRDMLGVEGARWVYRTTFGGDVVAVKDR